MYRNLIKDNIDAYQNHFNNIYLFIKYNPFSEISSFIPNVFGLRDQLKPLTKQYIIDLTNKPRNVELFLPPIFYLPTKSGFKKLGDRQFKYIDEQIKKNNLEFDFIHSHFIWPAGYSGARLREKYDVPFVITAHGYDIYDLPFRDNGWKKKIEYALNSSDYIITVSHKNLEYIKKLDVKTRVKVIPNGFDKNLFYPRDTKECRKYLNLPLDKKIILTVGNLVEIKGHEYLINSIKEMINYRKDILCIIIGTGKLKNKLEKQINKFGLENHISLVGEKDHTEIPIWINACDIFVLPSLNEGNPTVMFECLGCGKPFIGTNVGGIPEIINSKYYGFVVEPKNSSILAEKLLVALDEDWDHKKIKNYASQFEWEILTKEIFKIYDFVYYEKFHL